MKTKRILAAWLASLAAILLVGPATIQAQELSYSELVARLTALESELQSQRMDFASYSTGGGPEQFGCKDCSKTVCDCGCPAWYAGYEVTFLRPYISDVDAAPAIGQGFGDEYGTGHRFVVGYDNGTGLGARLRYWLYNHNHGLADGTPAIHLDMDVLDGEVTLQERMRNWDLLVSGGVRYARLGLESVAGDLTFEGFGVTTSFEATRLIGSRGLYLIGNVRASMLFGEISNPDGLLAANALIDDEIVVVLENQLGVGWSRELGRGLLNVRGVWESQFWLNDTFADDDTANGFGSNLAFSGPTLSAEVRY